MAKRRFVVLGLGQFGQALAIELTGLGCEVLAVDKSARRVEAIRNQVAVAATADIRDREAMRELVSRPFDLGIIAIGSALEPAILATMHLKELGVEEIWAEATDDDRAEVLKRVGATRVISPERDTGRRIALQIANPNLIEFLPVTAGYGVVELEAPGWMHGQTLGEMHLRRQRNVAVIAVKGKDGDATVVPAATTAISPGDVLTVVGRESDLANLRDRA